MQKEESALLEAITREPGEDLPRLGFANWLAENGDSNRAELIRLQCNLERNVDLQTGTAAKGERLKELQDRQRELIREMHVPHKPDERPGIRELTHEIAVAVAAYPNRITFKRGIIDHLYLNNTPVTALPPDLHVGGHLVLIGTHITTLPRGLRVGGSLSLLGTNIAELPMDLYVGCSINLSFIHVTADVARRILTMPNLTNRAKVSALESAGFHALADEARRGTAINTGA